MAKRKAAEKNKVRSRVNLFCLATSVLTVLFLCGLLLTAPSYSKTEEPGKKPANQSPAESKKNKASSTKTEEKNSKETPAEEYSYDSTGKPDPFIPLVTEAAPKQRAAPQKKVGPLTPLQKYDLNELNLVAIIALESKSTAVLEDSIGFGYIVEEGMLIGKNDGIIKKITKHEIIIEEKVSDPGGNIATEVSSLTIQHQE